MRGDTSPQVPLLLAFEKLLLAVDDFLIDLGLVF